MLDITSPTDVTDALHSFAADERPARVSDKDLQRADGCGRIVLRSAQNKARIVEVFQRSPVRIMFPRVGNSPIEEAVFINTAGGIAGGDRLQCGVTAQAEASITVTSQAAEKVYRALNKPARIATRL